MIFNVSSDAVTREESEFFIRLVFARYGNDKQMSYENFEKLMLSLGIGMKSTTHSHEMESDGETES